MLYITTRDKNDVYTAHRTLTEEHGADGGLFVPFQLNRMTREQICDLGTKSFGQNVAEVLNLLFNARMDGWDVDFCIGRYPARLVPMSHRMVFAEIWHNPDQDFFRLVRNLASRIRSTADSSGEPTDWARIGVRTAVLFGLFGELIRLHIADCDRPVDVAVPTGDFTAPMAVWYARQMGLPVGNIICGCNDNGAVWELLHQGQMRTDSPVVRTHTPDADHAVPPDLERLVSATLGYEENERYRRTCEEGRVYTVTRQQLDELRAGVYAGVVSSQRIDNIIRSVYSTSTYIMDPYTALAYGGLQDYRTRYADTRNALVLSERSPVCSCAFVSQSLGISPEELNERLNLT